MKNFFKFLFIVIMAVVALGGIGLFWLYEKHKDEIIFVDPVSGRTEIRLEESEKDWIKKALKPIAAFIYREATIHNPDGDFLPDQIDDNLKQNIKDRIR